MDIQLLEEKMNSRIEYLKDEFADIRVGRANPQILNKVYVDYYGAQSPLNQVASISVPDPRQILIAPWDRSLLGAIERAIQKAEIGINPMNDGTGIRLIFPELNEERRKEIAKDVSKLGEDVKVSIRNIRRDAMDEIKKEQKDNGLSEDEARFEEEKVQKLTDKYIDIVSKEVTIKEKEVMEV